MTTRVFALHPGGVWDEALAVAARALRDGGLVAFPTETVYGLGANALDTDAVARIFAAKGRPADNPLIVHVAHLSHVRPLVRAEPDALPIVAGRFWPGPLTLVLPRSPLVPDVVTAGLDSVAIRLPNHPVALALLNRAAVPVAAPSANRSGRPSPTQANHVLADLNCRVDVILDGGPTGVGVESTVLDLTSAVPTILRPGGVTREQLAAVLGRVEVDPRARALPVLDNHEWDAVRSPGMKYKHYAPQAPATLVEGEPPQLWRKLYELLANRALGARVGLLVSEEGARWLAGQGLPGGTLLFSLGPRQAPEQVAKRLFAALRQADEEGVDWLLMEGFPEDGVGLAVMNRLRRAAGGNIVMAGSK